MLKMMLILMVVVFSCPAAMAAEWYEGMETNSLDYQKKLWAAGASPRSVTSQTSSLDVAATDRLLNDAQDDSIAITGTDDGGGDGVDENWTQPSGGGGDDPGAED
jgi:hypothetical protein